MKIPHALCTSILFLVSAFPVQAEDLVDVACNGYFPHHLQGVCVGEDAIYWSFTTALVKTDYSGKHLVKVPVDNHHGDLCFHEGKVYVAVNLGNFNDPAGNADSWVYVYDADSLSELSRHAVPEVFYGAGGIGVNEGKFFVVGGLPDNVSENYVYEYDNKFEFIKKHTIKCGHTHLGIQTASYALGRWWFGCYGSPKILLVTDSNFQLIGRHEFDCSLGIVGSPQPERVLVASGQCDKQNGCSGKLSTAEPDSKLGLRRLQVASKPEE